MERKISEVRKENGKASLRGRQCLEDGIAGGENRCKQVEFFMRDTQFVGGYRFTYRGVNERDAVLLDISASSPGRSGVLARECPVGEETVVLPKGGGKKLRISPHASQPKKIDICVEDA